MKYIPRRVERVVFYFTCNLSNRHWKEKFFQDQKRYSTAPRSHFHWFNLGPVLTDRFSMTAFRFRSHCWRNVQIPSTLYWRGQDCHYAIRNGESIFFRNVRTMRLYVFNHKGTSWKWPIVPNFCMSMGWSYEAFLRFYCRKLSTIYSLRTNKMAPECKLWSVSIISGNNDARGGRDIPFCCIRNW